MTSYTARHSLAAWRLTIGINPLRLLHATDAATGLSRLTQEFILTQFIFLDIIVFK